MQAIDRPVVQPKLIERPRLAGFLADEIKAGRIAVEDAVDRSVVTIRGDELFASGSASIIDDFQPLMLRIADAVRKVKGQVRVTGHSDNRPIATLRFPSNWALSEARANSVLQILSAKNRPARTLQRRRSQRHRTAGLERYNRGPRTQSSGRNHSVGGGGRVKAFFSVLSSAGSFRCWG